MNKQPGVHAEKTLLTTLGREGGREGGGVEEGALVTFL